MPNRVIELMDDMHLSSQATFLDYYTAMQNNNISSAANILKNNPSVANQIMNADNINILLNETYRRELIPKIDIDYFLEGLLSVYQKMIDFTKVMGEWDANTQYNVHNLVYYNEKAYYVYPNTAPPIGTPPTDTQYWREYDIKGLQGYGGINLNFKFNWDNTQDYKIGDVVIFQNKMWYAVANNTNYEPNLNHYPWVVISMPKLPAKTPIQKAIPSGYDIGDFWFQITQGDEVIVTTWRIRQPEPTPRFASSAFSIGTNIYIAGGIKSNFDRTNVVEMFDTTLGTWSTKANMPTKRARAASFSIGNNGYCVGGINENGTLLNINEMYDSTTNSWSSKATYPIPIVSTGITANDLGYIIGGETTNSVITGNSYSYNPATNTWTAITAKPTITKGHTLASDGTSIYAVGGIDSNKNTLGVNEAYTISSKTWSQKDKLSVPRSYLSSFIQSGFMYAVGGLNSDWYSMDTNEKYDIANNEWSADMPMNYKRSSLNALVSGTRGFAIGGIDFANSDIRGYNEQYNIDDIPSDFEMIIDTRLDTTGSKQITIPTPQGGNYDYWIDWGDGLASTKITTYNDPQATHTYMENGEYTVKLMGTLDRLKFTGNIANDLKSVTKCILNFSTITDMFNTCLNLESVCDGIFDQSINVTNANNTFKNCAKLKTIPLGLFDNNNVITEFISTFEGCGIVSIPTGLFNGNNLATNFSTTFYKCSGITSIPSGLFNNNKNVTNFYGVFSRCFNLQSIPDGLFASNSLVENFSYAFNVCEKITSIPSNLFGNANGSVFNYSNMFSNCTSLVTIPEGLFQYAQNTTNYDNIFASCPITSIPNNCFNGNNASVENIFDVTKITSIGDNALKGLAIPTGFFQGATSLTTVGDNVFDTNVTNFYSMFSGCSNLTTLGNIDFSKISVVSNLFKGCSKLANVSGFKDRDTKTKPTVKINLYMNNSPALTHNSLVNVKNSLVTMTPSTKKTLWLHNTSLGLLTTSEKLEIINKNWTLTGYNPETDLNQTKANDFIQHMYGNSTTQALTHVTTSLYYYVKLVEKSNNSNVINLYAIDKKTGIVYNSAQIPTEEYAIFGGTNATAGKTIYVSKTANKDTNGALLKQSITNLLNENPTYVILSIGTNYSNSKLQLKNSGLENIQNANSIFEGFNKLTTINIYGKFAPTSMTSTFKNCSVLNSISFSNFDCSKNTSFSQTFSGCSKMANFSFLEKADTSKVTNMTTMFNGCSSLTTMPNINMANVTYTNYMFAGCSKLTTINPGRIGANVQTAQGMFQNCKVLNLKNITDYTTIFGHNDKLTDVSLLFNGCTNLQNVGVHCVFDLVEDPEGFMPPEPQINQTKLNNQLFRYCPNITNMNNILAGCTNIGTDNTNRDIPMGLFYHCPKLKSVSRAFYNCKNITVNSTIPGLNIYLTKALFVNNPVLEDISYLFFGVQTDLFGENPSNGWLLFPQTTIVNAEGLFQNCVMTEAQGYENIPFIYKSKVLKNISKMYAGQTHTKPLDSMYQDYAPEYSWDNLQNIVPALENCSNMFEGNINLEGSASKMITSLQKIPTLTNHTSAFKGCTKLSDYNSIPADWK